jgi:membrane-associated HD superfamily phosphohydrolase
LDKDLAEDYLNESLEYSQILISSSKNIINRLDTWVSKYIKESKNNYRDIDNAIYNKSIRNLESILESKNIIKKTLISENKKSELTIQETNLPISSMVKIANETLKKEISLNESEQKELNEILSLNGDDLKEEFTKTKKIVLDNLKNSINESKDNDLNNTISKTIEKIKESKCNHYEYYKLKKLSLGL